MKLLELAKVDNEIAKYPSLTGLLEKKSEIKEQLTWSINDRELERGVYRLHCLLNVKPYKSLFNMQERYKIEALMALIAIDSCKSANQAKHLFSPMQPKKDSVEFFFDTLKKMPDIYPAFKILDDQAKHYITKNLPEYCHLRHMQFGEASLQAIEDFLKFSSGNQDGFELMYWFWAVNLVGFDVPPSQELNKEVCELTLASQRLSQFEKLVNFLKKAKENWSTNSREENVKQISAYYIAQIPLALRDSFSEARDSVKVFVGRLSLLLADRCHDEEKLAGILKEIPLDLFEKVAQYERDAYKKLNLRAVTFLPAVFWAFEEINGLTGKSLLVYLDLQCSLFKWLSENDVNVKDLLGENRSIPLFSLTKPEFHQFLKEFSKDSKIQLNWEFNLSGKFFEVKVSRLEPTPQLRGSDFWDPPGQPHKETTPSGKTLSLS